MSRASATLTDVTIVRRHAYEYADYVALEAHSPVKHEFFAGEIYAMAGGTPRHAALAAATLHLLTSLLPKGCRAYTSDLRVRVPATGLSTYPDGAVVCGKTERAQDDELAVTNPKLLLEVTSPSSEDYDRGEKLEQYQRLPSVREVLIVSHAEERVTRCTLGEDQRWSTRDFRRGEQLEVASFGGSIDVGVLYDLADEG